MQALGRLCAERGVLFGLHDNYIDFYPDAEGFSYEHITFSDTGLPKKAWINLGREAQSYQWRPDHIRPFVERNLRLIGPRLRPTAYFVDVFSSASSFAYYDRQGQFHSKLETRRCWGEAFALIRNTLGSDAPTISEAGGDHLVGCLDGADCQFLQLTDRPRRYCTVLRSADWSRVPWFDAVNHTRFSLHGVGYSNRYQGGWSRPWRGIESDDYLSAELLTGHALMIDRLGMVRGAVRKYWLAHELIRSLAQDEIAGCEFAEGDIHRPVVTWQGGAKVYVNRGRPDWPVEGRCLPQYGYWATAGRRQSSIERIGDAVVEQSRGDGWFYVNGRGDDPDAPLAIRPSANRIEPLGQRKFKLLIDWEAERPAPRDLSVFMHFYQPQVSRMTLLGFSGGGGRPKPPTSQWQGRVTTGDAWTVTIPDDCPPGRYEILVGLYDPQTRPAKRYRLRGDEDPERRHRIGTLVLEGRKSEVTGIRLEKPESEPAVEPRLEPVGHPTDFGAAVTAGAFRCQVFGDRLLLTPLPDSGAFSLTLRLDRIVGRPARVTAVRAIGADGAASRAVEYRQAGAEVSFTTVKGEFAYQIDIH